MADETPTYIYFALGRLGRGEVLNLLLKDAAIDAKEMRYPYDETWRTLNAPELQKQDLTRTGSLPVFQWQGHNLRQTLPILRYVAREIGGYDGETSFEKYEVDAVADIYIDWRFKFAEQLTKTTDDFKTDIVPDFYRVLSQYYSDHPEGPYLLGNKITYADFAVYQAIDNNERLGVWMPLPESLVKFREAFESRERIAAYIKEHKVKGA
ncbi:glutathione S-transferase [Trichoderma chlorosporum]